MRLPQAFSIRFHFLHTIHLSIMEKEEQQFFELREVRNEVGREVGMRRSKYPKWTGTEAEVAARKKMMTQSQANFRIGAMRSAYARIKELEEAGVGFVYPRTIRLVQVNQEMQGIDKGTVFMLMGDKYVATTADADINIEKMYVKERWHLFEPYKGVADIFDENRQRVSMGLSIIDWYFLRFIFATCRYYKMEGTGYRTQIDYEVYATALELGVEVVEEIANRLERLGYLRNVDGFWAVTDKMFKA